MPTVSVIIPTYNRPDLLALAVRSCLSQTLPDIEIIVINDAGEPVDALLTELDAGRGQIISIRAAQNKKQPAARNLGLKVASGKYIAYLDDDDYYFPDHLQTLYDYLEANNAQVAYSSVLMLLDGEESIFGKPFDKNKLFVTNEIVPCALMHAKECIEKIGDFDESLPWVEDWDLWIRLAQVYEFHHIDKATAAYTRSLLGAAQTSSLDNFEKRIAMQQKLFDKYAPLLKEQPKIREQQNNRIKWMHKQNLNDFPRELLNGRELVLWGTGYDAALLFRICEQKGLPVKAFLDSNPQKIGRLFFNLPVFDPNIITEHPGHYFVLIATAVYAEEIAGRCREMGLVGGEDFY